VLVYLVENVISGTCYIGKTVGTAADRWVEHQWSAKRGSNLIFHKAIRKYGQAAFTISVMCYGDAHDEIYSAEQFCVAIFRAANIPLYNSTDGGPGSYGLKHSEATRAKQRAIKLGHKQSPETIAKRAQALRGKRVYMPPLSAARRQKIAVFMRGRKHSLGNKHTAETKARMSIARKAYIALHPGCTATR
jgi:group I intron endonuclease